MVTDFFASLSLMYNFCRHYPVYPNASCIFGLWIIIKSLYIFPII